MTGDAVVVTGRGAVTAAGATYGESMRAFRRRKRPALEWVAPDSPGYFAASAGGKENCPALRRLRTADPFTVRLGVAVAAALADAGLAEQDLSDVALIMNSTAGSARAREAFLGKFLRLGPAGLSPAGFLDSLISMAAGHMSMAFGIKSAISVVSGTNPIPLALDWLRQRREDTVIVCAAEEFSTLTLASYERYLQAARLSDVDRLGQNAGALVFQRSHADATPAMEVVGAGSASGWDSSTEIAPVGEPSHPENLRTCMSAALDDAATSWSDVRVVACLSSEGSKTAELERAALQSMSPWHEARLLWPREAFGQTFAGSGLLACMAVMDALDASTAPAVGVANSMEMGELSSVVIRRS